MRYQQASRALSTAAVRSYLPTGAYDAEAVFEHAGAFYKNVRAAVTLGSSARASNFSFRNPPTFCADSMDCRKDPTGRGP